MTDHMPSSPPPPPPPLPPPIEPLPRMSPTLEQQPRAVNGRTSVTTTSASSSSSANGTAAPLSFSPGASPLGRRVNVRLGSPHHTPTGSLSSSSSSPSLHALRGIDRPQSLSSASSLSTAGAGDAPRRELQRSNSINRLSQPKQAVQPIVTSFPFPAPSFASLPQPPLPAASPCPLPPAPPAIMTAPQLPNRSPPLTSASFKPPPAAEQKGDEVVAPSGAMSPIPNPLNRPHSISLSLPSHPSPALSSPVAGDAELPDIADKDEEEAPTLVISHSLGATVSSSSTASSGSEGPQQPLQQPASSASSISPLLTAGTAEPVTPITPVSPLFPPPLALPAHIDRDQYKDQLDGVLQTRKRGDSHLNLHSLDGLAAPSLPARAVSGNAEARKVAFRVDRSDGVDLVDIIPEEQQPRAASRVQPSRGILKTVNMKGTEEERRRRQQRAAEREKEWVRFVQRGSTLTKYNAQGKPQKRWVHVSDDAHEIVWEKPRDQWLKPHKRWDDDDDASDVSRGSGSGSDGKSAGGSGGRSERYASLGRGTQVNKQMGRLKASSTGQINSSNSRASVGMAAGMHSEHSMPDVVMRSSSSSSSTAAASPPTSSSSSSSSLAARARRRSSLPSMRIMGWKINPDRTRFLADVLGVHYGPYHNAARFERFLQRKDYASGFSWLAFSIEFPDRTLDLVAGQEDEVTRWFMAVQALAPMSVHHLTLGGVLWQRLIMKLNHYGLEPVRTERVSSWTTIDDLM